MAVRGLPQGGLTLPGLSAVLTARGKKIPGAGAQCLALTFLAKSAGSKSVFDLVLLLAK